MLKSNYTDLKVIHVDVPTNVCKFYSVTGDQLATFNISDILKDGILVGEAGLSLHRAEDGFYVLKFVDHPDFRDHSYYKLKPPILEVSVDKCQYKQDLIEIEGSFFYLYYGKRRGEPHLVPVTTIREDNVEYLMLHSLKRKWISDDI